MVGMITKCIAFEFGFHTSTWPGPSMNFIPTPNEYFSRDEKHIIKYLQHVSSIELILVFLQSVKAIGPVFVVIMQAMACLFIYKCANIYLNDAFYAF